MASIDLSQVNALIVELGKGSERAHQMATIAVRKTAADIKKEAQAFCLVDTGNLKSSISYETNVLVSSIEAEIGPTAAYGIYVEEGTSRMAPAAFMGPAFDRQAHYLDEALGMIAGGLL